MKTRRILQAVVAVWALLLLPLAVSAEEDRAAIIEAAKKEGKLVWYTPMDVADCDALFSGFTKKYPFIQTELYRASGVKILSKVMTETRMGKYLFDVIGNAPDRSPMWIENDLIMPYESPERKFYEEGMKDKLGYWTAIYMNTHVITYNTKLVAPADVPRSYEDLLHPKWKGKLAIDIKDHQWWADQLEIMGQEKGREFFRKLVKQDLNIRSGHSLLNELLVAGEFPVVVNAYAPNAEQHKSEGAPIEWVPVQPVIYHTVALHLAKKSAHPNCGKLFIDYALSKEGQEIVRDVKRIPCRSDVEADPARLKKGFDGKGLKFHPYPYDYIAKNYSAVEKEYTKLIKGK